MDQAHPLVRSAGLFHKSQIASKRPRSFAWRKQIEALMQEHLNSVSKHRKPPDVVIGSMILYDMLHHVVQTLPCEDEE